MSASVASPRTTRWIGRLIAAVVGVVLGVVGTLVAIMLVSGSPIVLDEWMCSDGEAPTVLDGGGRACEKVDATLPAGTTWDPLGNRPYECDRRWGWVKIQSQVDELDVACLNKGLPVPQGWQLAR